MNDIIFWMPETSNLPADSPVFTAKMRVSNSVSNSSFTN